MKSIKRYISNVCGKPSESRNALHLPQLLILLLLLTLFITDCQRDSAKITTHLQTIAERVGKQYVPDSRLDVFQINMETKGDQIIVSGEVINRELPNVLLDSLRSAAKNYKIINNIKVLPTESIGNRSYGIITISVANLRRQPKFQSELVSQTVLGTVIRIYKEKGDFYYVQNWDHYLGWLSKASVTAVDSITAVEWQNASHVMCMANYGTVTQQAATNGTNGEILVDLVPGAVLKRLGEGQEFVKVKTPDGNIGYVKKEQVVDVEVLQQVQATRAGIVQTSRKFLGVPYLWGGTSAKGFDCSGFVQTVFLLNNMSLPRDANQIALEGQAIQPGDHFENLFQGDLVFFGSNPGRITHVGIYLGNGLYIHSSGYVHINSLDMEHPLYNEYRHKTFRKARRIL